MSITTIGSLGNYMKNFKLQTQWQMKKQSGDILNNKKSLQEWVDDTSAALSLLKNNEKDKNSSNIDVEALYTKIQSGKKLTAAEKDYLRMHDPQMYEKVKSIERERKAYEDEIKRCKTKEDVQRAKFTRISVSLSTVKSIENNPNIPMAQKLACALLENAKMKAIEEVTLKFVESGEYAKLPTEAEYAQAMKELNEQRKPEAVQDDREQEKKPEDASISESGQAEADAGAEAKVVQKKEPSEAEKKVSESEKETEVESDELRKAKRAKAKAAYQRIGSEWEAEQESAAQRFVSLDAKG